MRTRLPAAAAIAVLALGWSAARAGTITGTITAQAGGAPLAGAEVRVWAMGAKGWSIQSTTTTNGSGVYSRTVAAGTYLIDVRGPVGSVNFGDRWYDVVAPSAGGYVGEYADAITVGATQTVGGINVALEVLGGADGTVTIPGGGPGNGMLVRMERRNEVRIHHNDRTKSNPPGLVSMRGMVPATDYQIMAYDPAGVRDTLLRAGPYTITSNTVGSLGTLAMVNYGADPYENNNSANCSVAGIDVTPLHMDPPQAWQSQVARIGPLTSGDVDWFCFQALEGDRLFITATTAFTFSSATRYHPWTDPVLSLWRGARVTKVAEDDDSGAGGFDARLDSGPLPAGCHCAAVTTFGDSNYVGVSQGSTGEYRLQVSMGNRPPILSIRKGTTEVPPAPAILYMDEGDALDLNLGYADADHDPTSPMFTHVDSGGAAVTGGTLNLGPLSGTYSWTAAPGSQAGSPYTLRLRASDAEFSVAKTVLVVVNGVNGPPGVPMLVSPIDDAVVSSGAPPLTWTDPADPENDPLSFDVEVFYDDPDTPAAQTATVTAGGGGTTTWTPATIAENTRVLWRVRARDGQANGISPWSGLGRFLVDTQNDPPDTPILLKPADSEYVVVRRPGLSVLNVEDPEDDDVEFVFQIANDIDFNSLVWASPPVTMNPLAATTMAATGIDLTWGSDYYARVRAEDVRGGVSGWSDVHHFRIKDNLLPGTPTFDQGCQARTFVDAPVVVVGNVIDPEGEPVVFELLVFPFEVDPETANPVYRTTAQMDTAAAVTSIPIDITGLANGHYRYRVRASDGTDTTDWIECEFTLEVPEGEPPGGCCEASGPGPASAAVPLVLVLAGLLRRRRTRAERRQ